MDSGQLLQLKTEITTDPKAIGYAAQSDSQVADLMNAVRAGEEVDRDVISTWEVLASIVKSEWDALATGDRLMMQIVISAGEINIKDPKLRTIVGGIFGAGTTTRANLAALQKKTVSRAEAMGLPKVEYWDVGQARNS